MSHLVRAARRPQSMSKVLDAAEKEEWEELMVRRLLEVVWYLQRM
jgi:hypothetical protein